MKILAACAALCVVGVACARPEFVKALGMFQVTGRRLIATGPGRALIFDLPARYIPKSLQQATFETPGTSCVSTWSSRTCERT
jgi:hypothetical protein